MLYCNHCGVSTLMPKKAPKARPSTSMQEEKPRCRKTRRSTIGYSSVSSQIRKERNPITAMMASTQISVDENQSRSLPSSSMICSAATQTIKSSMPTLSTGLMTAGS